MSLKQLHLISVGKPKAVHWRDAATHYLERLGYWRNVRESIIKDADASLPVSKRKSEEGKRILAAVSKEDIVICLDEHGKSMTSPQFSQFLDNLSSDQTRRPCFIIGGAFGLEREVLSQAKYTMALGPQTLPHELARVVLLEQIYRAECILRNTPYHHV